MNIFNIGKANARIQELESELATLKENSSTVEKGAEQLQADLLTAKTSLASVTAQLAEASTKVSKLESDLAASVAKQSDFDTKVATAASAKAGEIVAAAGHPPITTPVPKAQNSKPEVSHLTGLEKVTALLKAENKA